MNREDDLRGRAKLLARVLAAGIAAVVAEPALAGSWLLLSGRPGEHALIYMEQDKDTFGIRCGHDGFDLLLNYPGRTKGEGLASTSVIVTSGNKSLTLAGIFVGNGHRARFELGDPSVIDRGRHRPLWVPGDGLFDLLESGRLLIISAGNDSYTLPPVDAKSWRKPFEGCR